MKKLGLPHILSLTGLLALGACVEDDPMTEGSAPGSSEDGTSTGGNPSEGEDGEGDESSTSGGDSAGGSDDPLQACLDLPEAQAAGWVPGMPNDPTPGDAGSLSAVGPATWANALRLLREVHPSGTIGGSPVSMMGAAAMGYAQLGEVCGGDLLETIGFDDGDAVGETFGALLAELEQRNLPAIEDQDAPVDAVEVSLSPSHWSIGPASEAGELAPFGPEMHGLEGDDLGAMNTVINCVIEEQTQGILPDFLPMGTPSADTSALNLLVTHVAAPWGSPLQSGGGMTFTTEDGDDLEVDSLRGDVVFGHVHEDEDVLVLRLPMRGGELETMFVMPKSESLTTFLENSDAESLVALRDATFEFPLELRMPKVQTSAEVIDLFEPLGVECENFTLRVLLHGAAVTIDENGVAAAAAGAAEEWNSGGEVEVEQTVILDRPYAFFVIDRPTNAVLFNGRFDG